MNDRDYTRKRQKVQRQRRFITKERAASRKHIRKTARRHKEFIEDDYDDYEDAPDEMLFR